MEVLEKISQFINRFLMCISGLFLMGMITLTCANIFFRFIWIPVKGTFELMGFFGAIVIAFALGYTQIKRYHISVDVLINSFSPKIRKILDMINNVVCILFFTIVALQLTEKAKKLSDAGEVTETLRIVYYPFIYGVAFGCSVLCLVFFTYILKVIVNQKES